MKELWLISTCHCTSSCFGVHAIVELITGKGPTFRQLPVKELWLANIHMSLHIIIIHLVLVFILSWSGTQQNGPNIQAKCELWLANIHMSLHIIIIHLVLVFMLSWSGTQQNGPNIQAKCELSLANIHMSLHIINWKTREWETGTEICLKSCTRRDDSGFSVYLHK